MNFRTMLVLAACFAFFCVFDVQQPTAAAHTYSGNYVAPVTFNISDTLTAAQLNQAINHVHNTFGNINDSHISSAAAIAHTKLATPSLVPKAMALALGSSTGLGPYNWTACTTGTCTLAQSSRITSVTWSATGIYHVTLAYTPADATFMVHAFSAENALLLCRAYDYDVSAPHFKIRCENAAATATNSVPSFTVWDSSN
ncbi:hypothetical protein [Caudoviricetes sp.]|nr:hypothetical protein [Caudoviricetes sp.]